ncbi:NAD(+) diphosphatase [Pedococcus sp. 5OH_020]|uniref:NAD(+) diphosphatase n=1 Tax=Pedococcus sp. 5OH_020 TaxID=2989814 RepID=UPI0022E9ABEE|nr:NAD(+) diphosphatase [Pedococcus sp. 5OH_020]
MGRPVETLPNLSLARPGLDRQADRRLDHRLVEELLESDDTRVLELRDGKVAVTDGQLGAELVLRRPVPEDLARLGLFLGADGDHDAYVAVVVEPGPDQTAADELRHDGPRHDGPRHDDDPALRTMRQVGADLGDRDASLFTTALALANWHAAHPFCARCGAPTEPAQAGWLRRCTKEGSEHYPRTDVAVIMSVIDDQDRLLMARGAGWAPGRFSVLAGFLEPGESLSAAVAREVREEVGLDVEDITYLGDQPWPFPTSLMVGFTARAHTSELKLQESEIAEARWFTRQELRDLVADGSLGVSPRLSIARRIVEHWLGHEITGVG